METSLCDSMFPCIWQQQWDPAFGMDTAFPCLWRGLWWTKVSMGCSEPPVGLELSGLFPSKWSKASLVFYYTLKIPIPSPLEAISLFPGAQLSLKELLVQLLPGAGTNYFSLMGFLSPLFLDGMGSGPWSMGGVQLPPSSLQKFHFLPRP